jgi:hypothetical protein
MGIAEQMGRVLQRTSISVNIKERLDFSCALFGPEGSLVANAPHLPVHLGAMSEAIRYQVTTAAALGVGAELRVQEEACCLLCLPWRLPGIRTCEKEARDTAAVACLASSTQG